MPTFTISELQDPRAYPHAVTSVRVIQTHISWVCLAGDFAYKIKKPVDFGFLDFSTLEKRKALCAAELDLNRRFAPDLYIAVVSIVRVNGELRVGGEGEAIEWAVQMRRFPQEAQLDACLDRGALTAPDLAAFAVELVAIHERVPRIPPDDLGSASAVWRPVAENFRQIATTSLRGRAADAVRGVETWSARHHEAVRDLLDRRRAGSFVRECHGDLHLSNLVAIDGHIVAFDCIEFSAPLRWIDVVSDVAFLVMDLECRSRPDLAATFIDTYLAASGDYEGAALLDFYKVYRSLVRAKVAALQHDGAGGEAHALIARFDRHITYASSVVAGRDVTMYLTCGLSGSGKSWLSERLVPLLGAIRIRSDVERKRTQPRGADYSPGSIADVYTHMLASATAVLNGGTSVIVDATFIDARERQRFEQRAATLGVPIRVILTTAPRAVLESRIRNRSEAGTDPSDADLEVLAAQFRAFEEPDGDDVVRVDTSAGVDVEAIARAIRVASR